MLNPWVNKICDRDLFSHDVDVISVRDFPCTPDMTKLGQFTRVQSTVEAPCCTSRFSPVPPTRGLFLDPEESQFLSVSLAYCGCSANSSN